MTFLWLAVMLMNSYPHQSSAGASAAMPPEPAIIPRPAEIEMGDGVFEFTDKTAVLLQSKNTDAKQVAELFAEWLSQRIGSRVSVRELARGGDSLGHIVLATAGTHAMGPPDNYHLSVTPERVGLFATGAEGLFYGVQTLQQLIAANAPSETSVSKSIALAALRIADQPRFPWRGSLLDCGRHFMDKAFIKRYIDLLAYHKMNVLHWHLTEDQGWRIEIKKFPKLTEIGAWRKVTRASEQPRKGDVYGGFYSQDDVREIVAYAKSRYVTIVPEIEMPGHSEAALAAYPELSCTGGPFEVTTTWGVKREVYCAGNEKTFEFLEDVLDEVIELFPSKYIHIGGDECPKDRWKACDKCQQRIKDEGLSDEDELQSYFIKRIEKYLNSKGKHLIGWDEILEGGLAPRATVQSWRGMDGAKAAASAGHDVISSPTSHCYLDYAQAQAPGEPTNMGYLPLERCYEFEPIPDGLTPEQAKHVLGLEGNLWTEWAPQNRIDWQAFPRLCALAEVAWSPKDRRDWDDFSKRLSSHFARLDELDVAYRPANTQEQP